MAKGSAIYAIGVVKLPFVINLKFSRAVECKNILKLPRPTLPQTENFADLGNYFLGGLGASQTGEGAGVATSQFFF